MAPLVVIWSAWCIPQVYSLTVFLTAFFGRLRAVANTATCGRRVWARGRRHLDGVDYCGSLDL
jgi:hypothetical protein